MGEQHLLGWSSLVFLWKIFVSKTCVSLLPILKNTIPGFICRWSRDAACETIGELDVPLKAARVSWSFFRRGTPRLAAFFFFLLSGSIFSRALPRPRPSANADRWVCRSSRAGWLQVCNNGVRIILRPETSEGQPKVQLYELERQYQVSICEVA